MGRHHARLDLSYKESVQSRSLNRMLSYSVNPYPCFLNASLSALTLFWCLEAPKPRNLLKKPWRETCSVLGNYKSSACLWQCSWSLGVLVFWFKFDNWDVRFHSRISCFSVLVKYLDIGLIKLWRQGIWFPSAKKLQRSAWNLNEKMTFYTLKACMLSVSAFWTTVLKSLANYTRLLWEVVRWLKDIMMNQLF